MFQPSFPQVTSCIALSLDTERLMQQLAVLDLCARSSSGRNLGETDPLPRYTPSLRAHHAVQAWHPFLVHLFLGGSMIKIYDSSSACEDLAR